MFALSGDVHVHVHVHECDVYSMLINHLLYMYVHFVHLLYAYMYITCMYYRISGIFQVDKVSRIGTNYVFAMGKIREGRVALL